MIDPSAYLQGTNRVLLAALALLVAGSLVAAVPCVHWRTRLREQLDETERQLHLRRDQIQSHRPITAEERTGWERRYADLLHWIPTAGDEPRILAEVARVFEGGSVRSLEMQRLAKDSEDARLGWTTLDVRAPTREERVHLRAVPLHVRLLANYPDMARILDKLELAEVPVLLERLEIRREVDGLRLEADLTLVVQGEPDAA